MYGISIYIWLIFMLKSAKHVGKYTTHGFQHPHLPTSSNKTGGKTVILFGKKIKQVLLKKKLLAASQASLLIASGTCHRLHKQCLQQQRLAPLGPAKLCRSKNGAMSSAEKRRLQAWQVRMNQWWLGMFHQFEVSPWKKKNIPMYSSTHHFVRGYVNFFGKYS